MINKKNKTYFFVVISFVCIVFIVGFHILDGRNITLFDPIIEYIKQYHIKDVVNIVAILSGISAILVGVASIRISNLGAVKEYFQQGDNTYKITRVFKKQLGKQTTFHTTIISNSFPIFFNINKLSYVLLNNNAPLTIKKSGIENATNVCKI